MFISRSRMVEPLFPDLVVDGTVVEMVSELKFLGVILDSKLAFEKQVRAIAASASRRVSILRKTMDNECFSRCRCYCQMLLGIHTPCARVLFSVLQFVGQVRGGSAVKVSAAIFGAGAKWHLCVFFKINSLVNHPVRGIFPVQYVLRRPTRGALAVHSRSFEMPRSRTVQFSRSFVLSCVRLRNGLDESVCLWRCGFF